MISKPIARPLKKEGATVALSVLAGICSAGLNLSRPWLLGAIIGELVRSDPDHRIAGYIGAYLASWCLSWAAALTIRFAAAKVEQRILRSLRIDILTHLFNLPMAESERQPQGRIQAYMSSDLPAWARLYGTVLTQTVHSAVQFAGAAAALTSFGPALAWGVLPFLILGSAAPLLISRMLIGVNRSAQDAVSGMLERLAGLVRGTGDLGALHAGEWGIRRFAESCARSEKAEVRRAMGQSGMQILGACSEVGAYIAVLVIGSRQVLNGTMGIGELIGFLATLEMIFFPARNASDLAAAFQTSLASADRVLSFLALPVRKEKRLAGGELTIRELAYRYPHAETEALCSVNCTIQQGSLVVIAGESGSGKSTFIKLLAGWYDPTFGHIKGSEECETVCTFVPQESVLFTGDIMDNLRLDRPIEEDRIREMAERLDMDRVFAGMPDGYHTQIGDSGGLSGGQKQRTALIRALLDPGRLLIFDEPTTGLDEENARRFWEVLQTRGRRATAVVTTHRWEETHYADQVLIFREGRLDESYSRDEWSKREGRLGRSSGPVRGREPSDNRPE